uniref:hypothetical protein n=1 Tax=Aeromonas salmonicida TaxID=645 RepID=UPI003D1A75E5
MPTSKHTFILSVMLLMLISVVSAAPLTDITPMVPIKQTVRSQLGVMLITDEAMGARYVTTLDRTGGRIAKSWPQAIFGAERLSAQNRRLATWFTHKEQPEVTRLVALLPNDAFRGVTDVRGAQIKPVDAQVPGAYVNAVFTDAAFNQLNEMGLSGQESLQLVEQLGEHGSRTLETSVVKRASLTLRKVPGQQCQAEMVEGRKGRVCRVRNLDGAHQAVSAGDIRFTVRAVKAPAGVLYRVGGQWRKLREPMDLADFRGAPSIEVFYPSKSGPQADPTTVQRLEAVFFSATRQRFGDEFVIPIGRKHAGSEVVSGRANILTVEDRPTRTTYITTLNRSREQSVFGSWPPRGPYAAAWYLNVYRSPTDDVASVSHTTPADLFDAFTQQGNKPALPFSTQAAQQFQRGGAGGQQMLTTDALMTSGAKRKYQLNARKVGGITLLPAIQRCQPAVVKGVQGQSCELRRIDVNAQTLKSNDIRFRLSARLPYAIQNQSRYQVGHSGWVELGTSVALEAFTQGGSIVLFVPGNAVATLNSLRAVNGEFSSRSRGLIGDRASIPMMPKGSAPTAEVKEQVGLALLYDEVTQSRYLASTSRSYGSGVYGSLTDSAQPVIWQVGSDNGQATPSNLKPAGLTQGFANATGEVHRSRNTPPPGFVNPVLTPNAAETLAKVGGKLSLKMDIAQASGHSATFNIGANTRSALTLRAPADQACTPITIEGVTGMSCPVRALSPNRMMRQWGDLQFSLTAKLDYASQANACYLIDKQAYPLGKKVPLATLANAKALALFVPDSPVLVPNSPLLAHDKMTKPTARAFTVNSEVTSRSNPRLSWQVKMPINANFATGEVAPQTRRQLQVSSFYVTLVDPDAHYPHDGVMPKPGSVLRVTIAQKDGNVYPGDTFNITAETDYALEGGTEIISDIIVRPYTAPPFDHIFPFPFSINPAGVTAEVRRMHLDDEPGEHVFGSIDILSVHHGVKDRKIRIYSQPTGASFTVTLLGTGEPEPDLSVQSISASPLLIEKNGMTTVTVNLNRPAKLGEKIFIKRGSGSAPNSYVDETVYSPTGVAGFAFTSAGSAAEVTEGESTVSFQLKALDSSSANDTTFNVSINAGGVYGETTVRSKDITIQKNGDIPPTPAISYLEFSPYMINEGERTTVTIKMKDVAAAGTELVLSASNPGGDAWANGGDVEVVSTDGLSMFSLKDEDSTSVYFDKATDTVNFTIQAKDDADTVPQILKLSVRTANPVGNWESGQGVINLKPEPPQVVSISATPQMIEKYGVTTVTVKLNRTASEGEKIFIKRGGGSAPANHVDTKVYNPDGVADFNFTSSGRAAVVTEGRDTVTFQLKALENSELDENFEVSVNGGDEGETPIKSENVTIKKAPPANPDVVSVSFNPTEVGEGQKTKVTIELAKNATAGQKLFIQPVLSAGAANAADIATISDFEGIDSFTFIDSGAAVNIKNATNTVSFTLTAKDDQDLSPEVLTVQANGGETAITATAKSGSATIYPIPKVASLSFAPPEVTEGGAVKATISFTDQVEAGQKVFIRLGAGSSLDNIEPTAIAPDGLESFTLSNAGTVVRINKKTTSVSFSLKTNADGDASPEDFSLSVNGGVQAGDSEAQSATFKINPKPLNPEIESITLTPDTVSEGERMTVTIKLDQVVAQGSKMSMGFNAASSFASVKDFTLVSIDGLEQFNLTDVVMTLVFSRSTDTVSFIIEAKDDEDTSPEVLEIRAKYGTDGKV